MAICFLPALVFAVLMTSVSHLTDAACLNCKREHRKREASTNIDPQQLRRSLQLLDEHYSNALKRRLDSVVSRIRQELDNVTDVRLSFPQKEPDIVKRFSPVPVTNSRFKRVLRRGRHRRAVCKRELTFRPAVVRHLADKSKVVMAQLEIPKAVFNKVRQITVTNQDHSRRYRHMHSLLKPDLTQHDKAIFRLPRRFRKLSETSSLNIFVDYVDSCAESPETSDLMDMRLVFGLDELTADQAKRRFGRSPDANEFKIIRDCSESWDKAFLDSNDSLNALQIFECCRRKVRLNFDDTSLGGWVQSPKSFDAFYCIGRCARFGNFANDRNGDTDGEGFYATLMNEQSSALGVRPCCAPVAFRPLTVTTQHSSSEETTQTLADFIVTSCGCV